ncbi:hypothetical protein [Xanthomonas arboricola]|uniref:hypothetical protein n=1 Tax=Xanthomonas arboricola TaxID=56448 RepID=UPI001930F721|nr:hypothetical protein [Xanthomonas arboricola]
MPEAVRRARPDAGHGEAVEGCLDRYDNLPDVVKSEVHVFNDMNSGWLSKMLVAADAADAANAKDSKKRARAIFAAIGGAQLMARGRADIKLFDALIDSYQASGLLPK